MKKKSRLQMLAALLAATLSMALTSPIAAKANEEYNVDTTKESNAETGRIYYLKNSHGDVIGQMDENGNVLTSYAYNAFGEQVSAVAIQGGQKSTANRFLYAGEQYDETSGLYYLRARHYDSKAGRFTQEDTYLGDGRNLYAYVHSNPLKYVDPTGHATQANADGDTNLLNDEKVYDGGKVSQSGNAKTIAIRSQMQKQVERGQAPKNIDRVDKPHVPGQQPHIHFKDGTSLNQDGTIHDAHREIPNISNNVREWITQNGWEIKE